MRNRRLFCFLLIFALLFVHGCQSGLDPEAEVQKTATKEQKQPPKQRGSVPVEVPKELEGIHVLAGPGKYAGDRYDESKVRAEIDRLPKNLSQEAYYKKLLGLLAEDYTPYIHFFETFDPSLTIDGKGPDGIKEPALPEDQEVNIVILLDSSGSMAGRVKGGVKMDLAKKAVKDFASKMPEGANVSLHVYGHKGSNAERDKKVSCKGIEEVYPLGPYDSSEFQSALEKFRPAGWTPLAKAMENAKKELSGHSGDHVQNIVYVVSDGVETCGGDPVEAAKALNQSDIQAVVNIIGFDVDDAGQKALKAVADAGKGTYATATTGADLEEHFKLEYDRLWREWDLWEDEQQRKVDLEDDEKIREIDEMDDEMVRLADIEDDRLTDAWDYLEDVVETDVSEIFDWINHRESVLQDYANKKESELQNKVNENESKLQNELNRMEEEAYDKYKGGR